MVYLIEAIGTNRVKIGFTADVIQRLSDIQCGCPFDCKVIGKIEGDRTTERALHVRHSHLRIRGEWFRKDKSILSEFAVIRGPTFSPFLVVPVKAPEPEPARVPFLVISARAVEPGGR